MQKTILGSAMLALIVLGAVCTFVLVANMNPTEIITSMGQRGWKTTVTAEEGGGLLTSNAGGVLQVYVYAHSLDPGTDYATNLSNASALCYAHANNLNCAMEGNVPYGVPLDIIYKIRVNVSQCYNTTGSTWMALWVRMNITCPAFARVDYPLTEIAFATNAQFMWINFYLPTAGITHGQQVNITNVVMQCWM